MSESTLSMTYGDYRSEIGFYLGYGRESANWTTAQGNAIASVLKSGLRRFYNPPRLGGDATNHEWTFMEPVQDLSIGPVSGTMSGTASYDGSTYSTITATTGVFLSQQATEAVGLTFGTSEVEYTISSVTSSTIIVVLGNASAEATGDTFSIGATKDYILPDDFGAIHGGFSYEASTCYGDIPIVPEGRIRRERTCTCTGLPSMAAIQAKSVDGTAGQRFLAMFYPTPSTAYTMQYSFTPLPNVLSTSHPYPFGGEAHAETILASCLSVAEQRLHDRKGEKWEDFQERLVASIDFDRKAMTADLIGWNGSGRGEEGNGYGNLVYGMNLTVN